MFSFKYYNNTFEDDWDTFIFERSVNGTFLQSRRFINYHPEDRFEDCSVIAFDEKGRMVAICPACLVWENGEKVFYSHKGSTFGGIIIDQKIYDAKHIMALIAEFTDFMRAEQFKQAFLKITSDIFSTRETDLLQYVFQATGYREYKELSTYIDFGMYKEEVLSNFSQGKRTNVHNCQREGLKLKVLDTNREIKEFYDVLCENLLKYDTAPVHTFEELIEFKNTRLQNECEFFGIYKEEELVAGAMMFYFHKVGCAHTQYLAARQEYNRLSPMTFMYYSMICEMKRRGFSKLSWGIATEKLGEVLNMGLISSKEAFGSKYCNNLTYTIRL